MAPLPPNNTPRFRIKYTNVSHQHSMEVRSHLSPSALGTLIDDFFTALDTAIFSTVIDSVEFAADGSDIFNPVTSGIEGNVYTGFGSGTVPGEAAQYISFIGRSSGGRRVRLYVFGVTTTGDDFRFPAGEVADVDAARAVLVAAGDSLRCIDDLQPVWKTYANGGVNAHWQKALRP